MTFPVTINGNTYTAAQFVNYGHLSAFPNIIDDVATVAGEVEDAKTTAVAAANSTGGAATSSTSNSIGTGSKSFTIQTGKSFVAGQYIKAADATAPTTNFMVGTVTSYNSGTGALVMNATASTGSGTLTDWSIFLTTDPNTLGGTINGASLVNCPVKHKPPAPIFGTLVADVDYVIGYIDYDSTLSGGVYIPDEGTGRVDLYLSSNKTSASGTAITGGSFDALDYTTPDSNTFTANNTVSSGSPRYLVAKCVSTTGLVNVKGSITETKNTDD